MITGVITNSLSSISLEHFTYMRHAQPVIRLYSVPPNAFTEVEEDEAADDVEEPESTA
jgi:hypothetical protein